ncbi:hypothetical protein SAMN05920897_1312 [Alkalispirochaeta americana]|uniref:Uncharacterized protein n=1 Tax=Alkalispirochaeta americana TaxID=159291 RepID=A0A1N6XTQ1_9SPIO|nr:hypothetical protein [Alkalispirochaeta americana]SIR05700.1 hypothetical protein SAMN05920897_1312 [Alkalispirochaeta americana]
MGSKTCRFKAEIKWGSADEQPDDPAVMPQALITACELWKQAGGRSGADKQLLAEICTLTAKALRCSFIKDNLFDGTEDILANDDIEGENITVYAADFSKGCVPTVRASAEFQLPMTIEFGSQEEVEAWEEENDYLAAGVSFQFLPIDDTTDYLGSLSNHEELSLRLVE